MQIGKKFLLLTILISIFVSINAQDQWQPTGPMYGGDIRNIAKSPNGTLFAGLQDGSLYKRENINASWEELWGKSNSAGNYGFPGILIIDDSLIYCSSMGRGTLRSTDAGKTWTSLGLSYGSLSINSSNHIFHLGWYSCDDLSVSTDLGNTWRTIDFGCDAGSVGEVGFANNDSIWIVGSHSGVLISTDNGTTWEIKNSGLPESQGITSVFVNSYDDIFVGTIRGVYRSTNYGLSWLPSNGGLPANCKIKDLYAVSDSVIYAGSDTGVYLTTDAGESWFSYNLQANYLYVYKLIPFQESLLLATGESLIKVDSNSIIFFDDGIIDIEVTSFHEYSDKIYTATKRGIFYSENGGLDWITPDGLRKLSTSAITSSNDYIFSTYSNVLFYSVDGITTWNTNTLPTTTWTSLAATINNTLFANLFEYDPNWGPPFYSGLYVSTDFGSTWLPKPVSGLEYAFINFLNKDSHHNIYFLGFNVSDMVDYIYRSTNGGESFGKFKQGFPTYSNFVFYKIRSDLNNNHYLSTSEGIYFRNEMDTVWSFQGFSGNDVVDIAIDSSNVLYAATPTEIYYSSDMGLSYTAFSEGLPQVKTLSIFYSHSNNKLLLGTDKGVFKRTPPDVTSIKDAGTEIPTHFSLTSYPNPFNSSTMINFSLPERSAVKMSLYNSLGEKVTELLNREFAAGNQSVSLNATELSTGIYFCRIEAGKFSNTIKLVLIK
jgi:photosystem II stability/assembly factor-like uncharacterized protein